MLYDDYKWKCPHESCGNELVVGIGKASLRMMVVRHIAWHDLRQEVVATPDFVTQEEVNTNREWREKFYGKLVLTPEDIRFLAAMRIAQD